MELNVKVFKAAVLCFLLLLEARGSNMDEFFLHISSAYSCECRTPQLRAVLANTLLGQNISTSEVAIPACTLLHRCQESGCCFNAGYGCQPTADGTEQVELVFKLTDHLHSTSRYITVSAENHTSCACLPALVGES